MEKQQLASGKHRDIGEEEIIRLAQLPAHTPQPSPSCSEGETDFHPDPAQPKAPSPTGPTGVGWSISQGEPENTAPEGEIQHKCLDETKDMF